MSEKTGPITNRVRNSAMPVSTWLGGDEGSPKAFRVSPSTTMILVNDVASSSTEGAIDSTVIARIRVMELLGEPLPTEMFTPPAPLTAGAVGGVGAAGAVGAAEAGPASRRTATVHSSAAPSPAPRGGARPRPRAGGARGWGQSSAADRPLAQLVNERPPAGAVEDGAGQGSRGDAGRQGGGVASARVLGPERAYRGAVLTERGVDGRGVHLGEQRHLLLRGADHEHDVCDTDDVQRAGAAHTLPRDDLDQTVALSETPLLRQPGGEQQHRGDEGQRQDQPDDHPGHADCCPSSAAVAASVTISLMRSPKSSSTTTTSPRAISVPFTSRSAGALAARSSSTTSPGCSDSSSCTVMRVRPISTVTSMATFRRRSRLPRRLRAAGRVTCRASVAWCSPSASSGTAMNMPLSRSPSRAATGSTTRSEAIRTRPSVAAAASRAGRRAAATSILPTGELFRASTTSAETTRTTSPLTSPDRPAATAEAASRGSGTESGSLTGAPGASTADAGTSAAAALAAAITTAETVWESWSVRAAVMLSPRWRSSAA